MRKKGALCLMLGLCSSIFLILPSNAYAYLDPGTGSFIIQLMIAAFIGMAFSIKMFGKKIAAYFKKLVSKKETNNRP
jgi:hypothetical protein